MQNEIQGNLSFIMELPRELIRSKFYGNHIYLERSRPYRMNIQLVNNSMFARMITIIRTLNVKRARDHQIHNIVRTVDIHKAIHTRNMNNQNNAIRA